MQRVVPTVDDLNRLVAKFPALQLRTFRQGTEIGGMLQSALEMQKWDIYKDCCLMYQAFLFGGMECARLGCTELLLWTIAQGKIPKEKMSTLFEFAYDGGALDAVSYLSNMYEIDMTDGFLAASKMGRTNILTFLLVEKRNRFSQSLCDHALICTVSNGHLDATKCLVELSGCGRTFRSL